ncbi:MAG: ABC transporter ATP-binding protein [Betaproteobacteria bacterium]|nr:ABC transporter ATP-binding protein [Rhodocyclaceae bacterium]MCA3141340.1 ABC transporter ATP-binding protein [Rhodocyclaceae bacterium]MCE2897501.1 ABC transporter ATP-binding protein [Betaproteobacteria bacterium]
MSGETLIQARGLNAFYGRAQALFGVSLEVRRGEVVALLGRNGAGKSTTLKALMGLVPPRAGEVRIAGTAVRGWAPYRICRQGLGYVPEERRIFAGLTVLENLEVGRRPPREAVPAWTPQRLFELFPNLGRMRERPGGAMSGGEQQMLTIARTLMGNPLAVLLDEPSEGLAPVIVAEMARVVRELKAEGLTVLLSEQNLRFAAGITDRAYVMEQGVIRHEGQMAQLLQDEALHARYLAV